MSFTSVNIDYPSFDFKPDWFKQPIWHPNFYPLDYTVTTRPQKKETMGYFNYSCLNYDELKIKLQEIFPQVNNTPLPLDQTAAELSTIIEYLNAIINLYKNGFHFNIGYINKEGEKENWIGYDLMQFPRDIAPQYLSLFVTHSGLIFNAKILIGLNIRNVSLNVTLASLFMFLICSSHPTTKNIDFLTEHCKQNHKHV